MSFAIRASGSPADPYPDANRWWLDSELRSASAGVGVGFRPLERVSLRSDYSFSETRDEQRYRGATGAFATPAGAGSGVAP